LVKRFHTVLVVPMLMALSLAVCAAPARRPSHIQLRWLGQACFVLSVPGATVLMDPYGEDVGYAVREIAADVVTVSHGHFDHDNAAMATGTPRVLTGLSNDGKSVQQIDTVVSGIRFRTVPSFHDDKQGRERGLNAIFMLDVAGLRIVHLGDLGTLLNEKQMQALGKVDVLLIPVGGKYTIGAASARQIVKALGPRVVVPMHYKTPQTRIDLAPVDGFLKGFKNVVRTAGSLTLSRATLGTSGTKVVVMQP
jgi:L-ascorbate metabolism protein UlaG (beta-lactamase superfamily)